MIHVPFNPDTFDWTPTSDDDPYDKKWWDRWVKRADKARRAVIQAFREGRPAFPFKDAVWSDLKEFLLKKVFYNKCGYCESEVTPTDFGAAEHYRPKSQVAVRDAAGVKVVTVEGKNHPGYFWLAHDYRNLLPACNQCNTGAKMNFFPIQGRYVVSPDEAPDLETLDAIEQPLLLNPYKHHPENHLTFGKKGIVNAVVRQEAPDEFGRASIEGYGLSRGNLVTARQKSQKIAWILFLEEMMRDEEITPAEALEPYSSGRMEHSRAIYEYILLRWGGSG